MRFTSLVLVIVLGRVGFAQTVEEIDISHWNDELASSKSVESHEAVLSTASPGPVFCATGRALEAGNSKSLTVLCPTEGPCDDPSIRDSASTYGKTVRLKFHSIARSDGTGGPAYSQVRDAYLEARAFFLNYGITLKAVSYRRIDDDAYYSIAPYSETNLQWLYDIDAVKSSYAINPDTHCNVFISAQDPGLVLQGFGTFPWMATATTATGGLWMNTSAMVPGNTTFAHELGHCFGLYHTHRGVSEVASCSNCYEYASGYQADLRGDFCSDTPPTPANALCANMAGSDCQGTSWGDTQYYNLMGLANCRTNVTPQQKQRMHCWLASELSGWF